jgi:hypothetical protein
LDISARNSDIALYSDTHTDGANKQDGNHPNLNGDQKLGYPFKALFSPTFDL